MEYLSRLPCELKLILLKNITDAGDIVTLKKVNRTMYHFVDQHAYQLPRFPISTVELRGSDIDNGLGQINLNLYQRIDGIGKPSFINLTFLEQLWKFTNYSGLDASPIFEWMARTVFSQGVVQVRLLNMVLCPKNCATLIRFIKSQLPNDYTKGQIEFKLSLVSCQFYEISFIELRDFFETFIDIGVLTLVIEDLPSYIFTELCHGLALADIHLVNTLRIQFSDGDQYNMTSDLYYLLTTVCKPERKMTQLIIDGQSVPLVTIADFIAEFCNSPFTEVDVTPPHLRCFFSIDNAMGIQDVKELRELSQKRIQSRKRRSSETEQSPTPKRKKTQIYVEFGYYEEDLPLNQTLHAVIGLSVNEYSDVRRPVSN